MAQYKTLRRQRYHSLKAYGFLPFEARELSKVRDTKAEYFRRLLSDRKEAVGGILREAEYNQWSKKQTVREIIDYIKFEYKERGYEFSGRGIWEWYREYRDEALNRGEYYPKRRKRKQYSPVGARIDRGKLAEQKRRYREKLKKRGY